LQSNSVENPTQAIEIQNAFFIKLGQGGKWEAESIERGVARIGWSDIPLGDITNHNWKGIERELRKEPKDQGAATRDFKALRHIVDSTAEDVWITFHKSRLWWCRLTGSIDEDHVSKFRGTVEGWSDLDIHGRRLLTADLPGRLSQIQRFGATACNAPRDILYRVLNDELSKAHMAVAAALAKLIREAEAALIDLHWKDFETLVDLIFRDAGWRRLSILGESMKYADLELEEPITGERYQVQVKSKADVSDLAEYSQQFDSKVFRKLFFVVHTPSSKLAKQNSSGNVELVLPGRLAEMVVNAGLVNWLLARSR
jgi:hypothetical protein